MNLQIPVTPKSGKYIVGAAGGRGRGGGRGNYNNLRNDSFGRGGRGPSPNRPSMISPIGKNSGDIGGSGPNVSRVNRAQSQEEWKRTGTEKRCKESKGKDRKTIRRRSLSGRSTLKE